jgi:hypothetical protein
VKFLENLKFQQGYFSWIIEIIVENISGEPIFSFLRGKSKKWREAVVPFNSA